MNDEERLNALKGVYEKWLTKTGHGYVNDTFDGGSDLLNALWLAWTTGKAYGPSDDQPAYYNTLKDLFDEQESEE